MKFKIFAGSLVATCCGGDLLFSLFQRLEPAHLLSRACKCNSVHHALMYRLHLWLLLWFDAFGPLSFQYFMCWFWWFDVSGIAFDTIDALILLVLLVLLMLLVLLILFMLLVLLILFMLLVFSGVAFDSFGAFDIANSVSEF